LFGAAVLGGGAYAASAALASHGDDYIDLASAEGATVVHDDSVFVQGGLGAGTGNFDPFTTANAGGSTDVEEAVTVCTNGDGISGCPSKYFDTHTGGDRTHEILLSAIPELIVSGDPDIPDGTYREFSLDANDQGGDDYMSIDDIHILLDSQVDLEGYDPASSTFSNDDATAAALKYELGVPVLMRSQTFTPGSGVSDITLLVPTEEFDTVEDCSYGSGVCEQWVYFYFKGGAFDPSTIAGGEAALPDNIEGKDWNVTSGFEEWRTRLVPVVNVDKTATTSFDRDFDWTVEKSVSTDSLDLFEGESDSVDWTVTWTKSAPIDSDFVVSGTITIVNPTGTADSPIKDAIPATINSVDDVLAAGGFDGDPGVECPVSFPFELDAGDSLVCTYSQALSDDTDGTNTVTVNIDVLEGTRDHTATADVVFGDTPANVTDDSATLSDARPGNTVDGDNVSTSGSESWSETFTCDADSGQQTNDVVITEDDSGDTDLGSASTTVNCYELSVSKTANTSFDRDWDWTIEKQVADGADATDGFGETVTLDLFEGESGQVTWKLTATRSAPTDSNHAINGVITISNPAPMDAVDVSVADVPPGGTAVIDCGDGDGDTTVTVDAGSTAQCTYSVTTNVGGTNTASATLFGVTKSGTANVSFADADASLTKIDETATWEDLDELAETAVVDGEMFTYNESFTCDADEGGRTNTARIDEDTTGEFDEDSASVDVNCYELSVSKTANTSFDRDWDWTIVKSGSTGSVTLNFGDSVDVGYTVTVEATKTDSNHAINGVITISNPAPMDAVDVSVADVPPGGTAVIDCGDGDGDTTVTVDAGSTAQCTYSVAANVGGTNTASATLFGVTKSGTADVSFADADATITETDASVDVSDSLQGFLGTVDAPTPAGGVVFSYSRTISSLIQGCGDTSIPNIASLATDDGATLTSNWNVDVTVLCTRSQLTPTGTECDDFVSETASDQEELLYHGGLGADAITSVNPGAFIYWAEIIHTGGSLSVDVLQDTAFVEFDVARDGPKLFDANCDRVRGTQHTVDGGDVTLTRNNLAAGTYYITVKYDSSSLAGEFPAGQSFEYTWATNVNGEGITNEDSLILKPI
jgi:hypothetical protein